MKSVQIAATGSESPSTAYTSVRLHVESSTISRACAAFRMRRAAAIGVGRADHEALTQRERRRVMTHARDDQPHCAASLSIVPRSTRSQKLVVDECLGSPGPLLGGAGIEEAAAQGRERGDGIGVAIVESPRERVADAYRRTRDAARGDSDHEVARAMRCGGAAISTCRIVGDVDESVRRMGIVRDAAVDGAVVGGRDHQLRVPDIARCIRPLIEMQLGVRFGKRSHIGADLGRHDAHARASDRAAHAPCGPPPRLRRRPAPRSLRRGA